MLCGVGGTAVQGISAQGATPVFHTAREVPPTIRGQAAARLPGGGFSLLWFLCVGRKLERNRHDVTVNLLAVLYLVKASAEMLNHVFGLFILL